MYPDDQQQLAACSGAAPAPLPWCPCAGAPDPQAPAPTHESDSSGRFALNPLADTWGLRGSARWPFTLSWDPCRSTVGSSSCSERDPACAAAHLHLLGEALCLIGWHLRTTDVSVTQRYLLHCCWFMFLIGKRKENNKP